MRYYIYVSDAKLEMLSDQLRVADPRQTKLTIRGGLGTWFGIERHVEKAAGSPVSSQQKLERVCTAIHETESVGSLDDLDRPWVEAQFPCYISYPVESETGAPVVIFHFQDPANCRPHEAHRQILLVGSAAYMMPRLPAGDSTFSPLPPGGHWRALSSALSRVLEGEDEDTVFHRSREGDWFMGASNGPFARFGDRGPMITIKTLFRVLHKQELYRDDPGSNVAYLGTPLYVEWIGS